MVWQGTGEQGAEEEEEVGSVATSITTTCDMGEGGDDLDLQPPLGPESEDMTAFVGPFTSRKYRPPPKAGTEGDQQEGGMGMGERGGSFQDLRDLLTDVSILGAGVRLLIAGSSLSRRFLS